jgi:hypothetical protein
MLTLIQSAHVTPLDSIVEQFFPALRPGLLERSMQPNLFFSSAAALKG